jgi:hypothetical protein
MVYKNKKYINSLEIVAGKYDVTLNCSTRIQKQEDDDGISLIMSYEHFIALRKIMDVTIEQLGLKENELTSNNLVGETHDIPN